MNVYSGHSPNAEMLVMRIMTLTWLLYLPLMSRSYDLNFDYYSSYNSHCNIAESEAQCDVVAPDDDW